jgi:hypothetical protein
MKSPPGLQPFLGLYLAFGVIMISIHLYDEKKVRKAERPFCHGKVDGVLEIDKKVDDSAVKGRIKMQPFSLREKLQAELIFKRSSSQSENRESTLPVAGPPIPPFVLYRTFPCA